MRASDPEVIDPEFAAVERPAPAANPPTSIRLAITGRGCRPRSTPGISTGPPDDRWMFS